MQPLFIQAGSPRENGYCESFNGKMRYELLDGEIFYSLLEAKIIIDEMAGALQYEKTTQQLGRKATGPRDFSTNT
ncbi:MAG: transposase [Bdellovibrionales bacterium]|nr:transposase [Bdellovibrionales bacterium]